MSRTARGTARRVAAAALAAHLVVSAGCAGGAGGAGDGVDPLRLRIGGSSTMQPLLWRWAADYMRETPGVAIYTEGGGSARGIEGLIAGELEICGTSRAFSPEEVHRLSETTGALGVRYLSAKDGIGVFVHASNPLRDFDLATIAGIFAGRIREWSELGAPDGPIHVYLREPNSGTRGFFREHVLHGAAYTGDAEICVGARALLGCVADDPRGIAFSGFLEVEGADVCRIGGIAPSVETVRSGAYPIVRYLYLYAREDPPAHVQRFVDWVLGERGQRVVAEAGFVPLWH